MVDDRIMKRVVLLVTIGAIVLCVAGLLTFVVKVVAEDASRALGESIGFRSVGSLNACCWYRAVGDWKPGQVRHWFAGKGAVAVVEDQATGYCHVVGLEDINFSQEKPW